MANRNAFGQTWWGAQWLEALTQIDFANRLPRGRTYANNGSVKQMTIDGGKIVARVKGSRPQPYQIAIGVPPLPKAEQQALLDAVAHDPLILSKLLNRELDPALLALANKLGIGVFPHSWKDLAMHCSCPDWAVPCKHLAAVVYLMSREIDGNPFLVFSLRGLDLIAALKGRDIEVAREAQAALPTLPQLLAEHLLPPSIATATATAATATVAATTVPVGETALDYSTVPDLADLLPTVLTASPAFFPYDDFRVQYDKILRRIGRAARRELTAPPPPREDKPLGPYDKPRLVLAADGELTVFGLDAKRQLFGSLRQLNDAMLPDLQPEMAALFHARTLCLHLLVHSALVPQLYDAGYGATGLRWLPALQDGVVRHLVQQLARLLPPGLLLLQEAPLGKAARSASLHGLSAEAQAVTLCSVLLDVMVMQWSEVEKEKPHADKVLELFFGEHQGRFDGPGEASLPQAMQAWLARLHLGSMAQVPVLCLAEQPGSKDFLLSVAVQQRGSLDQVPVPLAQVSGDATWQARRYPVLQTLALLGEFFPPLNAYLAAGASAPMVLSAAALPDFLFDSLPVFRLLGIQIVLPRALERVFRPRLSLQMQAKTSSEQQGFLNANDLFDFNWQVAIGSSQVSAAEFEQLLGQAHGIVLFRGEYVFLDQNDIVALRKQLTRPPGVSGSELLRIALAEEYQGSKITLDAGARALIERLTRDTEMPVPAGLQASLRPYQTRGYRWLYRNLAAGLGSVIADDMGLGKTVQVIATLLKLKQDGALEQGRALVVLPTSLLTNWSRELARFAPQLSVAVFHGSARNLATIPDVLLTTYGTLRSDLAVLKKLAWRVVIIDEAQNIKNPAAAQTKAVKALPAQSFIAMSGTPVENRLSEYWSIMDFANRGLFGTLSQFGKEFGVPIQKEHDQQALCRFTRISAPFLLRRVKSDKTIIADLPEKIEQDQYCSLTPEQGALYESVLKEALRVIDGESDHFTRQGLVLQMIMALKQICNHPAHYLKHKDSSAELSGKTALFLDLLDTIVANHEKVLVFTQYREMGELLSGWIEQRFGRTPPFLHGGVARGKRDEMVERFQTDRTERIFLLSLKAGGTGLNLTSASNVIHYDLWWNPAVEAQATDRAYRIGQQKNVQVHRLITRATFEERINDMIQSKRDLANLTVGQGENWIGNLSNAELAEVFRLG